jgi:hypothetical protein
MNRKGVFLELKRSTVREISRRAKAQDTTKAKVVDQAVEATEPVVTVNGVVAKRVRRGLYRVEVVE